MIDYMKSTFYTFMCGECRSYDDCEEDTLKKAMRSMRRRGWKIGKDKNKCCRCMKGEL